MVYWFDATTCMKISTVIKGIAFTTSKGIVSTTIKGIVFTTMEGSVLVERIVMLTHQTFSSICVVCTE